jgi:hypothetical protein
MSEGGLPIVDCRLPILCLATGYLKPNVNIRLRQIGNRQSQG